MKVGGQTSHLQGEKGESILQVLLTMWLLFPGLITLSLEK